MKQQCYMPVIYLSWAVYLAGLVFLAMTGRYALAAVWLISAPLAQWAYIRSFPSISRYVGYGRVKDERAVTVGASPVKVTLYTALGCPFCPLVEQRLDALQKEMGFNLQKVDVTLRPELLRSKGIRAVPVVEAGQRQLIGHVTSNQIAELILGQGGSAPDEDIGIATVRVNG